MAVNHVNTAELIGLIFCTESINISQYNIVYSRFNILFHLKIATLMGTSLHSSLNGTYLVDELYEKNDTSNQNCYGLGHILKSSLHFKQTSYLCIYQYSRRLQAEVNFNYSRKVKIWVFFYPYVKVAYKGC